MIAIDSRAATCWSERNLTYERALLGDMPAPAPRPRPVLAPMANYPGEGFVTLTKAEWARIHRDYKGTRVVRGARVRTAVRGGALCGGYLGDAKRVDPPEPGSDEPTRFRRSPLARPWPRPGARRSPEVRAGTPLPSTP